MSAFTGNVIYNTENVKLTPSADVYNIAPINLNKGKWLIFAYGESNVSYNGTFGLGISNCTYGGWFVRTSGLSGAGGAFAIGYIERNYNSTVSIKSYGYSGSDRIIGYLLAVKIGDV